MKLDDEILIRFRVKGEYVVCTFGQSNNSEQMEMGRMSISLLDDSPGSFERWQELMKQVFADALRSVGGPGVSSFDTRPRQD